MIFRLNNRHKRFNFVVFLILIIFVKYKFLYVVRLQVKNFSQKMGGWRKLWFVLQNQLLLSYSSKDDYEKKLAPFKDVVSLVPGTTIRPTKGPRFIIETTTNLMLTYVSM